MRNVSIDAPLRIRTNTGYATFYSVTDNTPIVFLDGSTIAPISSMSMIREEVRREMGVSAPPKPAEVSESDTGEILSDFLKTFKSNK